MRRKGFTLVEMLVCAAILLILAAILFPVFGCPHGDGRRGVCKSNLKNIALGHLQYIHDYDDLMPLTSAGNQGWANVLQPYVKSWPIFQCPTAEKPIEKNGLFSTDYFLNARVAGLQRKHISAGSLTILLGEGIDNGGTNSHFSELPFDWKTSEDSPATRHLDGANYAFVDGHVKWLRPEKITNQSPKTGAFTFAIK